MSGVVEVRTGTSHPGGVHIVGMVGRTPFARATAALGTEDDTREGVRMLAQGRHDALHEIRTRYDDILDPDRVVWIGAGWLPIAIEALDLLREAGSPVRVIREDEGGLLIFARTQDRSNLMYGRTGLAVNRARERSRVVCEVCGRAGRPHLPRPGVRCDAHARIA